MIMIRTFLVLACILRGYDSFRSLRYSYRSNSMKVFNSLSDRQTEILRILSEIVDPDSGDDIITAGSIKDVQVSTDGAVNFISTDKDLFELCKEKLSSLSWITAITSNSNSIQAFTTTSDIPQTATSSTPATTTTNEPTPLTVTDGLSRVKHIIAVSSCKGGVGKSTVSVNLAYTLQMAGAKVGILDADIYGPSLPTMTKPTETDVVYVNNKLKPLEYNGVKLMSMGFINKGASIMRGPMVNQILNQFVQLCDWEELDYLILDMPPGTGDIQLTLSQIMNISAAVIVTTPQRLSFVDVVKGIDLFDTVNIPCVAVVENMAQYMTYNFNDEFYSDLNSQIDSLYTASILLNNNPLQTKEEIVSSLQDTTKRVTKLIQDQIEQQKKPIQLFGYGHADRLRDMWGIDTIIKLPLQETVSQCGDKGLPYVTQYPESEITESMIELATSVIKELDNLANKESNNDASFIKYNPITNQLIYQKEDNMINPFDLRIACRCATCVEEFTGKQLLDINQVPKDVRPRSMGRIGRYAVSIDWSDGHKSLYPFKSIAKLASSNNNQNVKV